ncbi:cytochrome P450 [Schizopora paradoxa]|uniref:Cytochrome P450 n=1 Tax=Schizopora paradoxa TaxID=27342 RepID=A0A0H2S567_9AGAM|nr:cytochrome P450 [Schizopora paradoxa]
MLEHWHVPTVISLLNFHTCSLDVLAIISVSVAVWLLRTCKGTRGDTLARHPLPPGKCAKLYEREFARSSDNSKGPKPLPFVGNFHQLPKEDFHLTYGDWAKSYGPIIYFHVFGRQFVVLNTMDVVNDLLVKRSATYSTRPHLVMAGELVGRDQNSVLFLKYGQRLKEVRRVMDLWIGKNNLSSNYPVSLSVNRKLLLSLLEKPDRGLEHIKFAVGSLMLKLTYGIDCATEGDPYIMLVDKMTRITSEASAPGRWLCDSFPILAKVPSWMPFAGFKRWAAEAHEFIEKAIHAPYEFTRSSVLQGKAPDSWLASMMLDADGNTVSGRTAENLWIAASAIYVGTIDTTVSVVNTFLLMMTRHPEIQRKAQLRIDAVIGEDRLPVLEDRESLPYIDNIIKETLRFITVVPIIPHCADKDDIYMGHRIPEGTYVMANMWSIMHDPNLFKEPGEFRPERFEDSPDRPAEPDFSRAAFGFGRRICPGYHFSMASLFMYMASILATFDILPVKNELGEDELPPVKFLDGHIRMPHPFKFRAVPRNDRKAALIQEANLTNVDVNKL